MSRPSVDIRADLHAEDETGFVWAFLGRAADPALIWPGNTVIAGDSSARVLAEVVDVVEGPSDKIVHLRLIDGSVTRFEERRRRSPGAVGDGRG